jgi:integrase
MSHIRKLENGRYQARWIDPSNRERSKVFRKKGEAEKHLTWIENSKLSGTYIDSAAGKVTVGAVAAQWYAGKVNVKTTTKARIRSVLDVHVLPKWEHTPVANVGHSSVQAWVAELVAAELSAATVRKIHGVLSGVLSVAVKDRRLASNPCKGVNLPRVEKAKKKYLTALQVANLAVAGAKPTGKSRGLRTDGTFAQNRLIVFVLAYTGLRWGELAALRVSSVNPLRRRIEVSASVSEVTGQGWVWSTPKDHEARSVPLSKFLSDELVQHMAGMEPDSLLFPSHLGTPLNYRAERRAWFNNAASAIGVEGLTLHELRHTAASLAVSAGANVKAVQRMLGHANAAMTLDTYAELFDDDLDSVATSLDLVAAAAFESQTELSRNPEPETTASGGNAQVTGPKIRALRLVPPAGFEPAPPPPEGGALSPELRGRQTRKA